MALGTKSKKVLSRDRFSSAKDKQLPMREVLSLIKTLKSKKC
jgi:hypothetical protein